MQETQIDNNLEEIDNLNSEGWNLNRKDPLKAIELGKLALKKSQEIEYKKGIALALKTIGAGSTWLSRHDDAMKYNFEAVELFSELGDKVNEAETNYTIGASFVYISDFDTGIKHYNKCYVISKEIGDELGMANGLNGIGTVYYRINENQKALEVLNESKILCEKHNNIDIYIKVLDGIGEAYYNMKQYDLALEYYIKCAKLSYEVKNKQVEAFAIDGLGRTYAALNENEKAIENFNRSIELRREIGFKAGEVVSLLNIGIFYISKKQLDDGIEYIEQSLNLSKTINSKEGQYKAYEQLAIIYELKKDYKKSIEFYKLFFTTKNEIITETTNQVIRSGETQRKVLQDQAEKLILEERSKDLESYTDNLILIGEIGQKIISQINVGSIVDIVHEHVNKLMDAAVFGIGIYNKEADQVQFPLLIERGGKFNDRKYNISDKEKFAVICFTQSREIIIGDLENEYNKYVSTFQPATYGKDSASIIYLPLIVKNKTIGVITVQSYTINAYNQYQTNILRNLASYTAIALDNANLYEEQEKKIIERTQEVLLKKEEVERAYLNNKALSELGQQITSTLNFEDIFSKLNQYVGGLMDAPIFSVRLLDSKTNSIIYKYRIENGKRNDVISVSLDDIDNYSVWCVTNKKEIFINDNQNEYHKYTKKIIVVSGEMPHSLIFYPIILGDKVLGCITVQSFEKFAYTDYHLDIIKTLATYTGIAIENANLFEIMEEKVKERTLEVVKQKEEVERTYENTRLLSEIGKEISSTLSVEGIITKVYDHVNKLMDAEAIGIGIYREKENDLYHPCIIEKGVRLAPISVSLDTERLATKCFKENKEYIINDWQNEYVKYLKNYKPLAGQSAQSLIYIPLSVKGKVFGVLSVQSFKVNAYNEYHVDILRNLGIHISSALDNANLYQNLEERVEIRTKEISTAYSNTKLLSEISEEICSSLSVETITSNVYKNVKKLFNAYCFGIGIYNKTNNMIEFNGFIENDKIMEPFGYSASDTNRFASVCFNDHKEIIINDYNNDYSKYIKGIQKPVSGDETNSIIYLPLFSKNIVIGVITIQNIEKNAFSEYQLNLLKNLAVSVGIALDNASLYQNLEEKIEERTSEVVKQKAIIEEKNKDITDSIKYAKKIQQAIMPDEKVFSENFTDNYVLYRPKDIVSGDFYWFENVHDDLLVFAVADCTGHGVPGAFMSLINNNIMNIVFRDRNVTTPGYALSIVDLKLREILSKSSDRGANDGMDIALCALDKKTNKLQYSGANRPLYICRQGELIEYKPTKLSIGGSAMEGKHFQSHEIQLEPNDQIYLFTDGFADQFGGPKGKKYKTKNLLNSLKKTAKESMAKQKELLSESFKNWKGNLEQVDDVLVIGLKI